MKLESNWQFKTLENLEKDIWSDNVYDGRLVKRIHALRKIPLNEFEIEDLRVMIRQGFSLDYMVPIALEVLKNNLFAEGDLYEGDLFESVLAVSNDFWESNNDYLLQANALIAKSAESGPFYPIAELRAEIAKWKDRYSNRS